MASPRAIEARYGTVHNISMVLVAVAMVAVAIGNFAAHPDSAPALSFKDTRFLLFAALGVAMLTYAWIGVRRAFDRQPQVVIDSDGIVLGFGRDRRLAWEDIQWVRLRRLALRPQLQIGLSPEAFVSSDLKLSTWHFDDGLRPLSGVPAALVVRDNGLDLRASAMLEAIKAFRPNLVRP
jgi:hypothetical protein